MAVSGSIRSARNMFFGAPWVVVVVVRPPLSIRGGRFAGGHSVECVTNECTRVFYDQYGFSLIVCTAIALALEFLYVANFNAHNRMRDADGNNRTTRRPAFKSFASSTRTTEYTVL
jgi:hypothetical protein